MGSLNIYIGNMKRRHRLLPVGTKSHKCVHLVVMLGSRLLDNDSPDSGKVYTLGNCDSRASLLFFDLLDILAHWPRKWVLIFCFVTSISVGSSGPTVVYALRRWLIAIHACTSWPRQQYDTSHYVMHRRIRRKSQSAIYVTRGRRSTWAHAYRGHKAKMSPHFRGQGAEMPNRLQKSNEALESQFRKL